MHHHLPLARLAAAVAFAIGGTAAMAATPTATQLPGKGKVVVGGATGTVTTDASAGTSQLAVALTGNTVIDWGKGSDINKDGVGGFNVGADATVNFTGDYAVLNIDSSGNASQIMGHVINGKSIFVANANGIIVGARGSISAASDSVGLIANTIDNDSATPGVQFAGFDGSAPAYYGTGGDVTVAKGATLEADSVLVSGGGTVNIDIAHVRGDLTASAGAPNDGGGFAKPNEAAQLNLTGDRSFARTEKIVSAGDASSAGAVTLNGTDIAVAGTFTNNGTLAINDDSITTDETITTTTWVLMPDGFGGTILMPMTTTETVTTTTPVYTTFTGTLDNENTVTGAGSLIVGALVNKGMFGAPGAAFGAVTATDGGLANQGLLNSGAIDVTGELANNGDLTSSGTITAGTLVNDGVIKAGGDIATSGDFMNHGSITATPGSQVQVTDGSLTNAGSLDGFVRLATQSDADFTAAADYAILNTGSIISDSGLTIDANVSARGTDPDNDTTGSFSNTGRLYLAAGSGLTVDTQTDLYLGGSLLTGRGADAAVVSKTNALGNIHLYADHAWQGQGDLTIATPLASTAQTDVVGHTVSVMADIDSVDRIGLRAASTDAAGYAVRIASGVTVSSKAVSSQVYVGGYVAGDHPDVILQGTIEANHVYFGAGADYAVGDVFAGPHGRVVVAGANPVAGFQFLGRIKNAPYTNAGNFRYNTLPIVYGDTASGTLSLELGSMAYTTHGTDNGLSAVNILVDGGPVSVKQVNASALAYVHAGDSAVTGVDNLPNTHLVLQGTGDITTVGNFFWPGYVYLGTIGTDENGAALPGSLGYGRIGTGGEFNNALPGNVGGASGIHFMTQVPLDLNGSVVTNAGAWVNFATDAVTSYYINAQAKAPLFFGGSNTGAGLVVSYGELDASMFHTHPVDSRK